MRTNALALVAELEKPSDCDNPSCLAQVLSAKLAAAVAGLHSIIAVDEQREAIVEDLKTRIEIRGGIIADLKLVDKNNQQIDTLGQDSKRLYEEQHRDDKTTIGTLQGKLEACRSNQKFVFAGGALVGGAIGYKLKGVTDSVFQQTPFASFQSMQLPHSQFFMIQTTADQRAREALKRFRQ